MSEDVNVLSQTVSSLIPKITGIETRLNAHEAAMNTILARVERLEDGRANAAKPEAAPSTLWRSVADAAMTERHKVMAERDEAQKRLAEVTANLVATQAEYRRVEEERNASWASERTLRNRVCEAGAKCEQALRDAAETKKLLEDARREVQSHAKDRFEALNKVESLTRELSRAKRGHEEAIKGQHELRAKVREQEEMVAKAREDRESERNAKERSFEANEHLQKVNERLKKQIEDLQGALAEARKETPAGVQDQFRLEKLGRLFDSLFAGEDSLTDETREFWCSLESSGWLRPSRVAEIVNMKEAAQTDLRKFKTDENTLRAQLLERVQYLENTAGDQRERIRELTRQAAEASEQARQARIAEDIQRAEKEHAVCPHCHRCATCGTA